MPEIHQRIEAELPGLRRYARALVRNVADADDLVQECLTRALVKLHLWREGSNLRAWLFTILHNQYVNSVRRAIRTGVAVDLDDTWPPLSQPATQEKRLELRDLDQALARLPAEQRTVIFLVGLEGMPYGDVAAVLGIPIGTVRSRLSRGRSALRGLMGLEPTERDEISVPDAPRRPHPVNANRRLAAADARSGLCDPSLGNPWLIGTFVSNIRTGA